MTNRRVLLVMLIASGWLFTAQRVASAQVTIPAGTELAVGLHDRLDTGETQDGDRFTGYLDAAIAIDGTRVLEKGTEVVGRVRKADKADPPQSTAEFDLEITDLRVNDALVPVVTENLVIDGQKAARLRRAGTGGGADRAVTQSGGSAVVEAFLAGREVVLHPETLLEFRLTQPVTFRTGG